MSSTRASSQPARNPVRRNSVSVRRSMWFGATLLACLLCCALGCSEISELAGLQDDTSNDYVSTLRTASDSRGVQFISPRGTTPLEPSQLRRPAVRRASNASQSASFGAVPSRSADLLHLLSTQRT